MTDATLIRLMLPDRPGSLAAVAGCLARHGVDILGLQVLDRSAGHAVDDLLLAGGDLDRALASLGAEVQVMARRDRADLPDAGLAMAAACTGVASASSLSQARRRLLDGAVALVHADDGVLLRNAGHGWLRPLAATRPHLPPIRAGEPCVARRVLSDGHPLVARTAEDWAPPPYRSLLPACWLMAVPSGSPPFLCLILLREGEFPFAEAEVARTQALMSAGLGVLRALGERPVSAPPNPAVEARV